jgi:hypothetical protein
VKRVLLAGLLILVGAIPALAQMPMMRMPQMPTEFKLPPVGSWCEYTIIDREDNDTIVFKYLLPGKEKCGDKECHWFEFQIEENEELNVVKMLVSGDPQKKGNLKRLIIKSGDEPAIEIPIAMMQQAEDESQEAEAEDRKEEKAEETEEEGTGKVKLGEEKVKTKAGEFECTHLRVKDEEEQLDLWMNESVPFFNLVKMNSTTSSMEITGLGDSGAKTAITEEPQPMPMPGIPGKGEE